MSSLKEAIPAWFRSSPQFREVEAQEQARTESDRQRWAAELEALRKEACAFRQARGTVHSRAASAKGCRGESPAAIC